MIKHGGHTVFKLFIDNWDCKYLWGVDSHSHLKWVDVDDHIMYCTWICILNIFGLNSVDKSVSLQFALDIILQHILPNFDFQTTYLQNPQ